MARQDGGVSGPIVLVPALGIDGNLAAFTLLKAACNGAGRRLFAWRSDEVPA
jgi:hypothetical protein